MSIPGLVLGGAQLGMVYGIANKIGQPDIVEVAGMVEYARRSGVSCIDTARAYGNSEFVIGRALSSLDDSEVTVVTKLIPLSNLPAGTQAVEINEAINTSVHESIAALGRDSLDALLVHRVSDIYSWQGIAWKQLLAMKSEGLIKRLGASVQSPEELHRVIQEPDVSYIQMPFNVLDYRWRESKQKIMEAKASRELTIHVRSALLQGLLVSDIEEHWLKAHCRAPAEVIMWLRDAAAACYRDDVLDFCLAYVRAQTWIDAVVVGMESIEQLKENIALFSSSVLSSSQIEYVESTKPLLGIDFFNPACWKG